MREPVSAALAALRAAIQVPAVIGLAKSND
jgi:hypothetical protein